MPQQLENRSTVAIIGAGPLGRWLALAAARAGYRVLLEDVMPANLHHAQEYIRQQLRPERLTQETMLPADASHAEITALTEEMDLRDTPTFHEDTGFLEGSTFGPSVPPPDATGDLPPTRETDSVEGVALNPSIRAVESVKSAGFSPYLSSAESSGASAPEGSRPSISPVTYVSTIEDAVREADLVIDCVPDELESKLEILWLLDRMSPPRTVLATPTTRLSITDLAACTYRAEKCVAIVAEALGLAESPASEILLRTTLHTTPETLALVESFWRKLGFTPNVELESTSVQ